MTELTTRAKFSGHCDARRLPPARLPPPEPLDAPFLPHGVGHPQLRDYSGRGRGFGEDLCLRREDLAAILFRRHHPRNARLPELLPAGALGFDDLAARLGVNALDPAEAERVLRGLAVRRVLRALLQEDLCRNRGEVGLMRRGGREREAEGMSGGDAGVGGGGGPANSFLGRIPQPSRPSLCARCTVALIVREELFRNLHLANLGRDLGARD
jgi:hypothetical protein